jgi:hypothetical protein
MRSPQLGLQSVHRTNSPSYLLRIQNIPQNSTKRCFFSALFVLSALEESKLLLLLHDLCKIYLHLESDIHRQCLILPDEGSESQIQILVTEKLKS